MTTVPRANTTSLARKPAFRIRHVVSFEDTNIIGNVYYVRHLAWQGRCRELFLKEHAPEILRELQEGLRLVTLRVTCDYYEELLPFDEVDIYMRLNQRTAHRLELGFEYYVKREGQDSLVAQATQLVGCMKATSMGIVPCEPPAGLLAALRPFET